MNKCNLDYKRVLNKGKSFDCSKWQPFITYTNDCVKQDFVTIDGSLFVCLQTHLSSEDNKPELVYGDPTNPHKPTGTNSIYWEYVLSGFSDWDKLSKEVQNKIIENIDGLDTPDTEVLGEYVSSVIQEDGKLKIKRTELPTSKIFSENDYFNLTIEQSKGGLVGLNVNIQNIAKQTDFNELKKQVDTLKPIYPVTTIVYNNLRILRNNGKLIPGTWYRITDYTTTVGERERLNSITVAEHKFDILVMAVSPNALSEEAKVIKREDDDYFNDSNLDAWKIWYCLDNDVNRFSWADQENGKGVIYRMIDEYGNDCPYDFKNILYILPEPFANLEVFLYGSYYRAEMHRASFMDRVTNFNIYWYCWTWNIIDGPMKEGILFTTTLDITQNTPLYSESLSISDEMRITEVIRACYTFDERCYGNIILSNFEGGYNLNINIFGRGCSDNKLDGGCKYNIFGHGCSNNKLEGLCEYNIFHSTCIGNSLRGSHNTFGEQCFSNTLEGNYNTFDGHCFKNTLKEGCNNNVFGDSCMENTLDYNCNYNTFDDNFSNNRLGNNCSGINFISEGEKDIPIQNYIISNNIHNDHLNPITISVDRGLMYETKISKNSKGEIKRYCEADLIE